MCINPVWLISNRHVWFLKKKEKDEKKREKYNNLEAWVFRTQSNINDEVFFAKLVNG